MEFKKYIHVVRLGQSEVEGLLNGTCYIFPKIDGTNSSVFYNTETNTICAGSRNRKITPEKDNAGFAAWVINSEDEEAFKLRELVKNNNNYIVYGEWLGPNKFVGHIKDYDKSALSKLWIFDIFNTDTTTYLPYEELKRTLEEAGIGQYMIPLLAKIDNPTEDELADIAQNNKFLLKDDVEHAGEGIVIHNYEFHDEYGHYQVGKLVLNEYKQRKKEQKQRIEMKPGQMENEIINYYLTDSEFDKNIEKVLLKLGLDKFDTTKKNCVGMFLSMCYRDTILSEIVDIVKRFKDPTIDFRVLRREVETRAKKYIGLE